ncbi:MAG: hypothetical protein GXY33_17420 [Phycisphaerae bacterium]|nr:hypothetical protein [Phycisphaerae bacterium]
MKKLLGIAVLGAVVCSGCATLPAETNSMISSLILNLIMGFLTGGMTGI